MASSTSPIPSTLPERKIEKRKIKNNENPEGRGEAKKSLAGNKSRDSSQR